MAAVVIRVQPGARRSGFAGWYGDTPRLAVAARPVEGAANTAAIAALAEALDVRPRHVRLVSGLSSRTKRFEVDGLSDAEIRRLIEQANPR